MDDKVSKAKSIIKASKLDGMLLINTSLNKLDPNIYYFVGKTFEYCALLFYKKNVLLTMPRLELGRAREAVKGKDIRLKIIDNRNFSELLSSLDVHGRIGINHESISLAEFNALKTKDKKLIFSDISSQLHDMRMQKTDAELQNIRKAAYHADKIISGLFGKLKNNKQMRHFKKESDIMDYLNSETRKAGLKTSFKPIVASAKNSANPHHDAKDLLGKGFCIIDFGVKYDGYCSDMTRTIYFGTPSKKERELYDLVLKSNVESIRFAERDSRCSDVDKYCKKVLGEYSERFIHGLGHGIGVEIHEGPTLNSKSKDVIKDNMVFTIEPGIYLPGKYGIRIEDDIIMHDGRKEIITKTSKELFCFDI